MPSSSLESIDCTSWDLKSHSLQQDEEIDNSTHKAILYGKDGHTHAIVMRKLKILNISSSSELKKSVNLLQKASKMCRNVSLVHDASMENDCLLIILNFYHTSLSKIIRSLDLKDTLRMVVDITRGTLGLWNFNVSSKWLDIDIDPRSILIDHMRNAYVTACVKDNATRTRYMAPEIWTKSTAQNEKSVSWSLGCIFYEMCKGENLWKEMNDAQVLSLMNDAQLPLPLKSKFSCRHMEDVISRCLNFEPSKRPNLSDLLSLVEYNDDEDGDLTWSSINWERSPRKTLAQREEELNNCLSGDNFEKLRMLLQNAKKDVLYTLLEKKDRYGNNLLHLACKQGSPNCTEELLNLGADAFALDGDGQNLLHMMASWRDTDDSVALGIMQKHKLDMGLLNHKKLTPLHLWIQALKTDLIVKWINSTTDKDHKVEIINTLGSGGTSLCMAMVASSNDIEARTLVSVLLTAGADPALGDQNGLTPLHIAVVEDDVELAKIILEGRTHLKDIKTDHGSPLLLALKNGAVNCLDLLLGLTDEKDIKLKDEDKEGNTMIHVAARGSHISFFLKFDTHISDDALKKKNHRGETPLSFLQHIPARMKEQLSPRLQGLVDAEKKNWSWNDPYSFGAEDMAIGVKAPRRHTRKGVKASPPRTKKEVTPSDAITGLKNATLAGVRSQDCTLIVTEGMSAETFARIGIDNVLGWRKYGVYALQGKPQNTNEDENLVETIYSGLIHALGVNQKNQTKIEDELKYGHVMLLTDQDPDGFHIKGLIIHFFAQRFPRLLKMSTFFQDFTTPLICGINKNIREVKLFKSTNEFNNFWNNETKRDEWSIEYCKGLASHDRHAVIQYFRDYKKHVRNFFWSPGDDRWISLTFDKDMVDRRKTLITRYKEGSIPNFDEKNVSYTHLFSEEISLYFVANVQQSIPSAIDGLKPSQRKAIFELLRSFSGGESVKVNSLSGRVIEHCAYNHGPQNLDNLIIRMSKTESYNINLIQQGVGSKSIISKTLQVGTTMGNPHARYLSVRISPLTPYLFPKEDDVLLDYVQANGMFVEPQRYVPVVPLSLINGCVGIASGYSSRVSPHKPQDVIDNIFRLMEKKPAQEMMPWYRGFKDAYKWTLQHFMMNTSIKDFKETTFEGEPAFKVTLNEPLDISTPTKKSEFMKMLGLEKEIHQNLNLLNARGHLVCYHDTLEVLEHFYVERFQLYSKRKELRISQTESEIKTIKARLEINDAQDSEKYLELTDLKRRMEELSCELENLKAEDIEVQWWKKDLKAFAKALEVHGLSEEH